MSQFIDSYYLVNGRNSKIIYSFLENISFIKEEIATEYPFPDFCDIPEKIFYHDFDLINFLENDPNSDYIIYWNNKNLESIIKQFTLQYTDDGNMIFGISIPGNNILSEESILLFKNINKILKSKISCITMEEPPPFNTNEFIDFCNTRYQ